MCGSYSLSVVHCLQKDTCSIMLSNALLVTYRMKSIYLQRMMMMTVVSLVSTISTYDLS